MKIFLLTHPRELERQTNTGSLVVEALSGEAKVVAWDRTAPDPELLACIEQQRVALLYPTDESELLTKSVRYENYIVIDATWQEARKIYNKSPYLHTLPTLKIAVDKPSIYTLRRNQKAEGLCTAEIVIELLRHEQLSDSRKILFSNLQTLLCGKSS